MSDYVVGRAVPASGCPKGPGPDVRRTIAAVLGASHVVGARMKTTRSTPALVVLGGSHVIAVVPTEGFPGGDERARVAAEAYAKAVNTPTRILEGFVTWTDDTKVPS